LGFVWCEVESIFQDNVVVDTNGADSRQKGAEGTDTAPTVLIAVKKALKEKAPSAPRALKQPTSF